MLYCILKENDDNIDILTISKISIPRALSVPIKLSFLRNTILTIIGEYNITNGGLRLIDSSELCKVDIFRANLEGVIQEVFEESTISKYFLAVSSNVTSLLDVENQSIESIFDNNEQFKDLRKQRKFSKEEKEAIVIAISACNL